MADFKNKNTIPIAIKHKNTYKNTIGGTIELNKVIISPATIFPKITIRHVSQKLSPKTTAKHVPVHTPVKGRGMATNKNTLAIFIIMFDLER